MSVILVVRMGINEVNLKETWEFPGSFLGNSVNFWSEKCKILRFLRVEKWLKISFAVRQKFLERSEN